MIIPVNPVAASRPRVAGSWGGYYVGAYKTFREESTKVIEKMFPNPEPLSGLLEVDVHVYVKRPKTTKYLHPRGDVDNFAKAVLDSLNGVLWIDDGQIYKLTAEKHWAPPDVPGWYTVKVSECDQDD